MDVVLRLCDEPSGTYIFLVSMDGAKVYEIRTCRTNNPGDVSEAVRLPRAQAGEIAHALLFDPRRTAVPAAGCEREIFDKVGEAMGSADEADRWLHCPALALDCRRPVDLIATAEGAAIVSDHLQRLEYGVYS